VQHRIFLEDNAKSYCVRQRRLNPTLQEVVKKEMLKWLDHDIIYPSQIVSKFHLSCSLKMGIIVINNDKDEFIPIRIQFEYRLSLIVCCRTLPLERNTFHYPC